MSRKRLEILPVAERDVEDAADHYTLEADEETASAFVGALTASYARIISHPKLGSPRYAHDLNIPDLRHVKLKRFPYLVFYVEYGEIIEIWRVLHAKRDVPAWLAGNDDQS